jgi:hypothetical protein
VIDDPTTFAGEVFAEGDDYDAGPCGVCECCPCNLHGCPVCVMAQPDTGAFGMWAPVVRGVSGAPATVTRSITRGRARFGPTRFIRYAKRATHRKHRRAWSRWCADPEGRTEPVLRSLTSWEVW